MKAGAATVDITPRVGRELSGFAMRLQPSTGVLDPLAARALYLETGGERLLWLHCDLIAVGEETVARFRRWARQNFGLEAAQVLLTATHTHAGPASITLKEAGARDQPYLESLDENLQAAAECALLAVEPCEMVATEGHCALAVHRRGPATAHTDPRVASVGFRRPNGTFLAVVVNYAIHPVALGHVNRLISGDIFSAAAAAVSRGLPGCPVVLMTNGACGNINPPEVNVPWSRVQEWGALIAAAVGPGLKAAQVSPHPHLETARRLVPLPLDWLDAAGIETAIARTLETVPDEGFGRKVRACVRAWGEELHAALAEGRAARTREVELQAIRLAGITFVGVNAEVFSHFGDWLRRDTGLAKVYPVGYANGDMGYLCTREAYGEGGYEVDMAHIFYGGYRFAAGALEQLAGEAASLVGALSASPVVG